MDMRPSLQHSDLKQSKILLVDDNTMTLKLLNRVLTSAGYVCEGVESAEEALVKIKESQPDLILTDYKMAGMSGLDLLRKIHEDGLQVGVILMTGSLDLETAIEAIRLGAYEYMVKPFSNDMILLSVERVLAKSKLLAENERFHAYLEKTFQRYVDPGVLSVLIAANNTTAFENQKLTASVLFADIRNFSNLISNLEVKELINLLNEYYFKPACEIILANKGTIDKFMGDGIMAVFGAPLVYEGHVEKSIETAVSLVETMEESRAQGRHPFKIGIGIATGEVLCGNIGSPQRMDFTVMGNAVTIAARLEKLAGPGMILIDAATRRLVAGNYLISNPLNVQLKGQGKPSDLYEIRPRTKATDEMKTAETNK